MPERPRDRLGRPLAWDAEGFPGVAQRDSIPREAAIAEARDYLERELPFHAHEVLEIRWRCSPDAERPLWQGLAQIAAGATHQARGNPEGARRLLVRGRETMQAYAGPPIDGVDELLAIMCARCDA